MKLLISCVGAYQNSGLGTGGLVAVDTESRTIDTIDFLDSTGLTAHKNLVFRFVRAMKCLIIYDQEGFRSRIFLREANDVHDIQIINDKIHVVSTGINSVQVYDFLGNFVEEINPGGKGDAWHINCIESYQDDLYFTAFGAFNTHREWNNNSLKNGFIFSLKGMTPIIKGLSGPHHPRLIDKNWWVCDSHKQCVNVYDFATNSLLAIINLGGFTRGMLETDDSVWVGVNADRKKKDRLNGQIVALDKSNFSVIEQIEIPLPEIYDVIKIPEEFYEALREKRESFNLASESDHATISVNFANQITLMEKQLIELRGKLKKKSIIIKLKSKIKSMIS
ncbi:DUF4915 domain-containing protein [Marivirga sp.]|uniref:DUF4915 domain-containing protein n=1 Tax=Marivirga sp. TaxID=2018662 RepID=UPI0025FD9ACB|nr:DUF4915 domain-containing protein [Marivirga sp.]